jgi:hypothetical protein
MALEGLYVPHQRALVSEIEKRTTSASQPASMTTRWTRSGCRTAPRQDDVGQSPGKAEAAKNPSGYQTYESETRDNDWISYLMFPVPMNGDTGYAAGGACIHRRGGTATTTRARKGYWSLSKCKKAYLDYLGNKTEEIERAEGRAALLPRRAVDRRTAQGAQEAPAAALDQEPHCPQDRRHDWPDRAASPRPEGIPRTPKQEQGAELATAVLRYVLDEQEWKAKSPECARDGAVDGIGGIEIEIERATTATPRLALTS